MKRKFSKKVWAVVLIAIMLVSVFPIAGLAEDEPPQPSPTTTVETSNLEEINTTPSPSNSNVPQGEELMPSDSTVNTAEPEPSPSMEPVNALPSTEETVLAEPQSTSDFTINPDGTITAYNGTGGDVVIPDTIDGITVTAIGYGVFENRSDLTSIIISDGITIIDEVAFSGCTALKSVSFLGIVTRIDAGAFAGCSALETVNMPSQLGHLDDSAFFDCSSLKSIVVPEGVESLLNTFQGCSALQNITLPSTLKRIDYYAFSGCSSLKTITLPASLEIMSEYCFENCTSLETVYFLGNAPQIYPDEYGNSDGFPANLKLYYYEGATGFTTPTWNGYACYPLNSEDTQKVQINPLPQEQQETAKEKVLSMLNVTVLNTNQQLSYYDLVLVNPLTGEAYTKDTFPKEGVDVTIPYPDEMSKDNYSYRLFHFPNGVDDEMVEITPLELTDAGVKFHVDSFSPFALLSEQKAAAVTATTKSPKTGDGSMDIMFLAILAIIAGSACVATVAYRKRHHKA